MANNYTQFSAALHFPKDRKDLRVDQVEEAIKLGIAKIHEYDEFFDEDYYGFMVTLEANGNGPYLWFRDEGSALMECVAIMAETIVEHLEIDEPFIITWADTCDKPRIDEFGGGGFAVQRGHETLWSIPWDELQRQLSERNHTQKL